MMVQQWWLWGGLIIKWQTCELHSLVVSTVLSCIILLTSLGFRKLTVMWFSIVIPVICYWCWLWL